MMKFNYAILKGKIVEKYNTQKNFAKTFGISERSLSLKLCFTQDEMLLCTKLLGESIDKIVTFFFTLEVQEVEPK